MEKHCEYCSGLFVSGHGLQKYCHSKYGISEYCKKEARKIKQPNVYRGAFDPILMQPLQFRIQIKHNEQILSKNLEIGRIKTVDLLKLGFNFHVFERVIFSYSILKYKVGLFEYRIGRNSFCEIMQPRKIATKKVQSKPSKTSIIESFIKINTDFTAYMKAKKSF